MPAPRQPTHPLTQTRAAEAAAAAAGRPAAVLFAMSDSSLIMGFPRSPPSPLPRPVPPH